MADPELKQQVEDLISGNEVLLFMKGVPEQPQCGFSQRAVQILESIGVQYGAVDALQALEPLREVTGELADWQTFPQLYVRGELVGGCDIMEEMHANGELAGMLGAEQPADTDLPPAGPSGPPQQSPPMDIDGAPDDSER